MTTGFLSGLAHLCEGVSLTGLAFSVMKGVAQGFIAMTKKNTNQKKFASCWFLANVCVFSVCSDYFIRSSLPCK